MRLRILATFTGYPDDTEASRTLYRAGTTIELAEDFARLIVAKGLGAEENPPTVTVPPATVLLTPLAPKP